MERERNVVLYLGIWNYYKKKGQQQFIQFGLSTQKNNIAKNEQPKCTTFLFYHSN